MSDIDITYKGSSIATMDASGTKTLLTSGKYCEANIVVDYTKPTPTQASHPDPTISVSSSGLITASHSQPEGYVSADTSTATQQLTTQAAKTVTPTTSSQTAVQAGRYTTGAVTVGAIPSQYIVPSGTKTVTANGTEDVTSYANVNVAIPFVTYTVGTTVPSTLADGDIFLKVVT